MNLGRFCFPKSRRLVSGYDYQRVFSNSKKISDKYFILLVRKNQLVHARLGFAISRKHIKKAVLRNRFKRIVRESFRLQQDKLANFDIVVIARGKPADASIQDVRKSIDKCWRKITLKTSELAFAG